MNRPPLPAILSSEARDRILKQPLVGGWQETAAIVEAVRIGRCCRLIGPRYHHKSQILRRACDQVDEQLGYISLYVSLWDARAASEAAFFTSMRDLLTAAASARYKQRLPRLAVKTLADLMSFFAGLPDALRALRAAYQTTATGLRFLSVVCASHSLARTALGPTSPFENISNLVVVRDLSPEETREFARQLVAAQCPSPTGGALRLIHEQTGGDRLLVSEVCRECCALFGRKKDARLTRDVVRQAIDSLVRRGGREAVAEGLHQIENNVDVLRAILLIMQLGDASAADLFFEPGVVPDPLTTSGFVRAAQGRYRIKSDLHYRLLKRHFSPERVGRILFAAGDWGRAIYYLGSDIRLGSGGTLEERAGVMRAAVSAMYSVQSKRDAYVYLARGFETAYPRVALRLYDLDLARNALVRVHHSPARLRSSRAPNRIPLNRAHEPEVRAVINPQEYILHPFGRRRVTLYVPLRSASEQTLGLAAIDHFVTQEDFRRKQDQIQELVGHLRHAACALSNRIEYESLYESTSQRAKDLGHLLKLTHELMSGTGTYQDVLDRALANALKALSRYAHMGSIYLYDRQTGRLSMRADTGYPEEIRAAAQFAPGEGLAGYVYKTGRPWIVQDTAMDRRYRPLPSDDDTRVCSSIGVPLMGRHGPLGVLCLDNLKRTRAFDDKSEQLLMLFAGQVALWLENAHLLDVLRDLNGAVVALRDLTATDPHDLLERIADRLIQNFKLNGCAIGLRATAGRLDFVVRRGLPLLPDQARLTDLPAALAQTVLNDNRPLVVPDLKSDDTDWEAFLNQTEVTSLVALPITGEGGQAGLVLLTSRGEFDPSDDDIDLLSTFVIQMAIARENADLYQKVHGELNQRIAQLQEANQQLEIARRREVQYRNARLATGLLHQINNAVANIPELVDELDEMGWSGPARAPLNELRLNAIAANDISRWLHQFVRIGNLTLEPVDLAALVKETQQRIDNRRPAHVRVLEPEAIGHVPPVHADRALIDILVENLLRNAYEAIPDSRPGTVTVHLKTENGYVELRFQDNGVGIPPDRRERIWEWGWTTKDVNPDSHDRGLGLFACRQIVDAHDGTIGLDPYSAQIGAAFRVRLPVAGPQPVRET